MNQYGRPDDELCDVRIWTFAKGALELTVEQWTEPDGAIIVTLRRADEMNRETVRAYEFADQAQAARFHSDLESSLIGFGWSFVGSLPERRTLEDRRHHLRKCDRRRWWSSGALIVDW